MIISHFVQLVSTKKDQFKIVVVCFQVAATIFRQVLKQEQNKVKRCFVGKRSLVQADAWLQELTIVTSYSSVLFQHFVWNILYVLCFKNVEAQTVAKHFCCLKKKALRYVHGSTSPNSLTTNPINTKEIILYANNTCVSCLENQWLKQELRMFLFCPISWYKR